ncbi:MAG: hypothetical protein JWS12_514 [Candidatus Saccharibacteria bacterium]|nr:hypothetical protein [Candidatus Saccharibacteria bacterium]
MKRLNNARLLVALLGVIVVLGGLGVRALVRSRAKLTLTSYETTNGLIYECSRPIKAKPGTVAHGHRQGPIPYNQSDADKYCHNIGIE